MLRQFAITQIVYLNIKPYAVINETVEVAKKIGLYPSFINAVLKRTNNKKKKVLKTINITNRKLTSMVPKRN